MHDEFSSAMLVVLLEEEEGMAGEQRESRPSKT